MIASSNLAHGAAGAPSPKPAVAHASTALLARVREPLLDQYCLGCHDADGRAGGLSLQDFRPERADAQPEVAERMIRKLRAGLMPPAGKPRPDAATAKAFRRRCRRSSIAPRRRIPSPARPSSIG